MIWRMTDFGLRSPIFFLPGGSLKIPSPRQKSRWQDFTQALSSSWEKIELKVKIFEMFHPVALVWVVHSPPAKRLKNSLECA